MGRQALNSEFRREVDLVDALQKRSRTVTGGNSHFVTTGLPVGSRIADVVICVFDVRPRKTRQLLALSRLSGFELRLLAELLGRKLKLRTIAARMGVSEKTLTVTASRLVRRDLIRVSNDKTVSLAGWARYLPVRIYFIEAKLSRWRSALLQASYYRQFGDSAFVALPATLGRRRDIRAACKGAKVGLLLVSPKGKLEVSVRLATQQRTSRWATVALTLLRDSISMEKRARI